MNRNEEKHILINVENGIQIITLNRPKKKNAIGNAMYTELCQILKESTENDSIIMTVITGAGDFFSSGNEISSLVNADNIVDAVTSYKNFVESIIVYPKLLVAVVNGPAIGIAVTILPLFDMVYASEKAYFQTPFTTLGLIAEGCSTYTFPRIMGNSKASDMLYMGYRMSAMEAMQYGLVSKVYKDNGIDEIWNYLRKVLTLSKEAILIIKETTRKWNKEILLKVNATEAELLKGRLDSPDLFERMVMMMSKRTSKI